jgi:flagellar biosynthesis protein FlhF
MKIKTFRARTFSEALDLVKKELSDDAIILSTEEKKGLRPSVEITAAVDYSVGQRISPKRIAVTQAAPVPAMATAKVQASPAYQAQRPTVQTIKPGFAEEIKGELNSLRMVIEGMKSNGYEVALPQRKKEILDFLRKKAVRDEFALLLCEKANALDDIPLLISSDIKIKRHTGMKKAVMLIGPTGVGKTTTIAKLAAHAIKSKRQVAIINLDTYRIGATEQIRIYSNILGIPLALASSTAEFKTVLDKFSETRDTIFIDTTGRNPRDETYIAHIQEVCAAVGVPLELHLLMNANGDDAFLVESYRYYRKLPIDYIAFSKVDEAVRFGTLYNTMLMYQKPVAYLTNGQRVPGDIEFPTVNRLASLILTKECA